MMNLLVSTTVENSIQARCLKASRISVFTFHHPCVKTWTGSDVFVLQVLGTSESGTAARLPLLLTSSQAVPRLGGVSSSHLYLGAPEPFSADFT